MKKLNPASTFSRTIRNGNLAASRMEASTFLNAKEDASFNVLLIQEDRFTWY